MQLQHSELQVVVQSGSGLAAKLSLTGQEKDGLNKNNWTVIGSAIMFLLRLEPIRQEHFPIGKIAKVNSLRNYITRNTTCSQQV